MIRDIIFFLSVANGRNSCVAMGNLVVVFIALTALMLSTVAEGASNRVALVIGNASYSTMPSLKNPVNDARLITDTLRKVGFEVDLKVNASQRELKIAIRDLGSRLRSGDKSTTGLFFYAGHGIQSGGSNYLIPVEAKIRDESDLEIDAVNTSWLLRQMEFAGNELNLVILDACRDNPLSGAFRNAARGLARMESPRGTFIGYSAGPGKVALDGEGANSPYSLALSKYILDPALDLENVFKQVRIDVENQTRGRQTPWEESSVTGSFYFSQTTPVPGNQNADRITNQSADADFEIAFWNSIKDSENPQDFQAYLDQYGESGKFWKLATLWINRYQTTAKVTVPETASENDTVQEGNTGNKLAAVIEDSPDDPLVGQWVGMSTGRTWNSTPMTLDVSTVDDDGYYLADYRFVHPEWGCAASLRIKPEGEIYRFDSVKGDCRRFRNGKFRLNKSKLTGVFPSPYSFPPPSASFSPRSSANDTPD